MRQDVGYIADARWVDSDRPQKPFQRQINDIWIAATALENGGRVVAYDSHFEVVPGLIVEAP